MSHNMKTKLPPIIILLCLTQLSYADNFTVDLGPQGLVDSERDLSFDSLAGTAPTGQSMTLNLSFGSEFLRVYPTTSPSFDFLLVFQTNVSGFLAFGTGSAFLTDSGGNIATSVFSTGGSASGGTNLPLIGAGIFPLFLDQSGTPRELDTNLDLYGAQFNLTFPVAQGEIT